MTGDSAFSPLGQFFVQEGGTATAQLIGRITVCGETGFQLTQKEVPGTGKRICYKGTVNEVGGAAALTMTFLNVSDMTMNFVMCSMMNSRNPDVPMPQFIIDLIDDRLTCTPAGTADWAPGNHFGCRPMSLEPGKQIAIRENATLPNAFRDVYVDFLRNFPVDQSCRTEIRGRNKFLLPVLPGETFVNTWVLAMGLDFIRKGSPPNGARECELQWEAGNWVTMANLDFHPVTLTGILEDAPTDTIVTLTGPTGETDSFTVPAADPANPTCLGAPIEVSFPYTIPPRQDTIMMHLELSEQCSELREGSTIRFNGEAIAEVGAPVHEPGESVVEFAGTCVVDDTSPQVERIITTPTADGSIDVKALVTDEITEPGLARLHVRVDGGEEEIVPMLFDDPPVDGDTTFFRQTIGPFPEGAVIEISVEAFDDVLNPEMTPMLIPGDIDQDGDVDDDDVQLILADRNLPVIDSTCGFPCDLDGNDVIDHRDARKATLLCTRTRCR